MQTSVFLAKLIGPFALILAAAVAFNRDHFHRLAEEFIASPALVFLAGVITLPAGLAIVLTHNVWSADWRILITIVGWLSVVAGIARMVFPKTLPLKARWLLRNPATFVAVPVVYALIGLVLSYFGYRA